MNRHLVIAGIALTVVVLGACGSDGADGTAPTAEFSAPADGDTVAVVSRSRWWRRASRSRKRAR